MNITITLFVSSVEYTHRGEHRGQERRKGERERVREREGEMGQVKGRRLLATTIIPTLLRREP